MPRKKPPTREAIGSLVAYSIDWHAQGFLQVVRAGGTIELVTSEGATYTITVGEACSPT